VPPHHTPAGRRFKGRVFERSARAVFSAATRP